MINILKSDLFKIRKNIAFYLTPLTLTILLLAVAFFTEVDYNVILLIVTSFSATIIGIYSISITYGSDLKAKNSQAVLGVGYSRLEYVVYKFVSFMSLNMIGFLYLYGVLKSLPILVGYEAIDINLFWMLSKQFLMVLVFGAMSLIIFMKTQSISHLFIAFILSITGFIYNIVNGLLSLIKLKSNFLPTALFNQLVKYDSLKLVLLVAYIVGFVFVSYIMFNRKELEF